MSIEQIIDLIMADTEAQRELIAMYKFAHKRVPEIALQTVQAQEEACIILKEVQKLYEETKKEDFGEDCI